VRFEKSGMVSESKPSEIRVRFKKVDWARINDHMGSAEDLVITWKLGVE